MLEVEQAEILLVEDSALDAELTMRGLSDSKLVNNVVWLKDGQQALDYIFKQGAYANRTTPDPRLIQVKAARHMRRQVSPAPPHGRAKAGRARACRSEAS